MMPISANCIGLEMTSGSSNEPNQGQTWEMATPSTALRNELKLNGWF